MAIVPNKDGMGIVVNGWSGIVDKTFCQPTKSGAGVPNVVPAYVGELYTNTTTGALFRAYGLGATEWMEAC